MINWSEVMELRRKVRNTVTVEVRECARKVFVEVGNGICEGLQHIDFDSKAEAVDYAVTHLYPFYRKHGRNVAMKI